MKYKSLFPAVGSLATLAIIFFCCKDYGALAEKTKKAAQDLIEQGRKVGVLNERSPSNDAQRDVVPPASWQGQVGTSPGLSAYDRLYVVPREQYKLGIGTFNIQVLGEKKVGDVNVMEIVTQIIRQFDVIAIQEFRAKDQGVLQHLLNHVNANTNQYRLEKSTRLGRSSSKEQYLYLYDSYRVEVLGDPFEVPDLSDQLHREPFVCRFRAKLPAGDTRQPFTFALANVHTDPDETTEEMVALSNVYQWLQSGGYEDDIIMLGDFNEPPSRYGVGFQQQPGVRVALNNDVMTNTRGSKAYDNLLFDINRTSEYTGHANVINMEQVYGLTREQALAVSDHQPVWAIFNMLESPPSHLMAKPINAYENR